MYVCGPTVYDRPHIGNARSVVAYDLLFRLLRHIFGDEKVQYVRNITDVDDKIIKRAREQELSISDLTSKTTDFFHEDMKFLNCLTPTLEPKATEHIDIMLSMIKNLIDRDIAYVNSGHVFFDVSKATDYTRLSGRSLEEMIEGVRIENSELKRNPADFVLWKPAKPEDQEGANFDSQFGLGRPGWHIECSAMSTKYLGQNFDIHGGGADLIFPHHTNEIAQSRCAYPDSVYAKYWVHNGFLTVDRQKMSKSLGNFHTVEDLRSYGISGDVLRLFLLSIHYRSPLDYNKKAIDDIEKTLRYWQRAVEAEPNSAGILPQQFVEALCSDLNISIAIRVMNDLAKQVFSSNLERGREQASADLAACMGFLGLSLKPGNDLSVDEINLVEKLVGDRIQAKKDKNWALADQCRDQLDALNIELQDQPDGFIKWRKK